MEVDVGAEDSLGEFDVEALFERMQENTREHRQVVKQRPSAQELAKSIKRSTELIYAFADTSRSIAALERGFDPGDTYEWLPRSNAVAEADRAWLEHRVETFCSTSTPVSAHWLATNPTRNPVLWGTDYLKRCFHTVIDSFAAIGHLTRAAEQVRAPIILARSALEAAATGCYIIDTEASQEERLRRTLNLHFHELKESVNSGEVEGYEGEDEREIEELTAFARSFGLEVRYKPGRHYPPVILGEGRSQPDSTRLVLAQVLPDGLGHEMWRSLSAVAHSRRSSASLLPDEYALPHDLKRWQRTQAVSWHTLPALAVVRELLLRMSGYLGWEGEGGAELLDAIGTQWAIGAGLFDDQIRARLGFAKDNSYPRVRPRPRPEAAPRSD